MIVELLLQRPFLVQHERSKWVMATSPVLTSVPAGSQICCPLQFIVVQKGNFDNSRTRFYRMFSFLIIIIPILINKRISNKKRLREAIKVEKKSVTFVKILRIFVEIGPQKGADPPTPPPPLFFAFLDELGHSKHKIKSVTFTSDPAPPP